eukprot:15189274-Ditylum_brightwellii.AAC.1
MMHARSGYAAQLRTKHGQIFAHASLKHTDTSMNYKPMPQTQGTPLTMIAATCNSKLQKPLHNWQQQQRRTVP